MKLEIKNAISRVWADGDELAALDAATSYPVEGANFSPAYKAGHWDGREHLLRASRDRSCHMIPTGVLIGLTTELEGAEIIDSRRQPAERRDIEWVGKELRSYQTRAIDEALRDRGWQTGRGLWNLPIRSGKTLSAAGLIQRSGLRTLFVVSSKMLLHQTVESFKEAMDPCPVAMLGDGNHKTDWITVATAQTLLARPKQTQELLAQVDLLIVDEAHHLEGEAWRGLILKSDAMYKIGLSATIFVSTDKASNRASIWLRACTGPILYRVSMDRLIQQGYIKQPNVLFYHYDHVADRRSKDWRWVVKEQLAQNLGRNRLIAQVAAGAVANGMRVHIDTGRHDQMKAIHTQVNRLGVACEVIHGNTPMSVRDELVGKLSRGECVLVGTVLGEGIDIPELEVVINAEGQKSATASIQRMRNLTMMEGKGNAYFVDIEDTNSTILAKHAKERLKTYSGLRGFLISHCVAGVADKDPLMKPGKR